MTVMRATWEFLKVLLCLGLILRETGLFSLMWSPAIGYLESSPKDSTGSQDGEPLPYCSSQ